MRNETVHHTIDVLVEIAAARPLNRMRVGCYLDISGKSGPRHYFWVDATSPEKLRREVLAIWERIRKYPQWGFNFSSRVEGSDGTILQIPCIDFGEKIASSGGYDRVKERLVSVMGAARSKKVFPGYLLVSGESFHYIGLELMTFSEWLEFLGLCLLCEDGRDSTRPSGVDRRWVGWSLIRQCGMLRIFGYKSKPEPYVVEYFGPIA